VVLSLSIVETNNGIEGAAMSDETERAIEETLEGKPRASKLAEMVSALQVRRAAFQRELDLATEDAGKKEWATRIREVDRQIATLKQEQAITEFVENSVRVTVNRPRPLYDFEED
jgi:hypothetical protein